MQAMAALVEHDRTERARESLQPSPEFGDGGLTVGRGTVLARHAFDKSGQDLADEERLAVLLSAGHFCSRISPKTAPRSSG